MSTDPSRQEWVAIGRILKPHGVRGEVKVALLCDSPDLFLEYLDSGKVLLWKDLPGPASPPSVRPVEVESVRPQGNILLVKMAGVDTMTDAEALRGRVMGLEAGDLPPAGENACYQFELEGLEVVDPDGKSIGRVIAVEENPAHDQLLVEPASPPAVEPAASPSAKPFRIPMVEKFILEINVADGFIKVDLPKGLIESQQ